MSYREDSCFSDVIEKTRESSLFLGLGVIEQSDESTNCYRLLKRLKGRCMFFVNQEYISELSNLNAINIAYLCQKFPAYYQRVTNSGKNSKKQKSFEQLKQIKVLTNYILKAMKAQKTILAFVFILCLSCQQQLTLDEQGGDTEQIDPIQQIEPIVNQDEPSQPTQPPQPTQPTIVTTPTRTSIPSGGPRKYSLISTGVSFLLPINIGGLNYNLQIDSGSSDIFIKGEQTPGIPASKYSCSACINTNQKYSLSYLDGGSAQTYEIQLPVNFQGFSFRQSILVAYQTTLLDDDEGIVGLSFAAAAQNPNPTFLQTLINQNIISSYSYGLNINLKSKTSSYITLGSYDPTSFSGNLIYLTLSSQTECLANIDGVRVGSSMLSSSLGLFDTGNTAITFQRAHQSILLAAFKSQNNECFFHQDSTKFNKFYCKVGQMNELPRLTLSAQGQVFDLEKQAYLEKCYRSANEEAPSANYGIWYCQTLIDVGDEKEIIIGDAFFNRYYAYFDLQNNRIGLAKNKENLSISNVFSSESYDENVWNQFLPGNSN